MPQSLINQWYEGNIHVPMKKLYKIPEVFSRDERLAMLNGAFKVTFVRHPFVRLVSTFQDLVIREGYWKPGMTKFPSSQKVINKEPNFDQFVAWTLRKMMKHDEPNAHFEFFWKQCDMCLIDFDVIGKLETSEDDIEYIFKKGAFINFVDNKARGWQKPANC